MLHSEWSLRVEVDRQNLCWMKWPKIALMCHGHDRPDCPILQDLALDG